MAIWERDEDPAESCTTDLVTEQRRCFVLPSIASEDYLMFFAGDKKKTNKQTRERLLFFLYRKNKSTI